MSTGPSAHAALIQGNQSPLEPDAPHSALLYLFQEVSKLPSPIHSTFLDPHSASTWLNETAGQGPLSVKREEESMQLFNISNSSCHSSLSCLSPLNQMKNVKEESYSGRVTNLVEPQQECNSPWRVLSLINLQCERLLNPSDVKWSEQSSESPDTTLDNLIAYAVNTTAKYSDQGGNSLSESQKIPAGVSPRRDVREAEGCKPQDCLKDSCMSCCVQSSTAEEIDSLRLELAKKSATSSPQAQNPVTKADKSSLSRHFGWNQECQDCLSSEQNILNVLSTENASVNTLLPFNSEEETIPNLSKPALTLDHNANFTFTSGPLTDNQLISALPSSQSSLLLYNTPENSYSLSNQEDQITAPKPDSCDCHVEEKSLPITQFNSSICNGETNPTHPATSGLGPKPVHKEDIAPASTQQWRSKTPRKQRHPSRSADIQDPDFQGVTFRMDTELDDSKEHCRLLITSKYSGELCKRVKKPRLRTRTGLKSLKTSSSDEENNSSTSSFRRPPCGGMQRMGPHCVMLVE
ncbi:GATA-type zinc finger protein 1 isoform X2 [Cheilinus undulatus]|uniref:GATA-type zinc finger protein 1 isoform X2 n=1 Tax=Cheilinus undulatus TaxID=241271 RepID=UPI001BD6808D|nr:GATA-type zinc finger protein 1 isoform X2 [Cheilinus undulatus]